jgi:exosortase
MSLRAKLASIALVGGGFLLLYHAVIVKLVTAWWTDDNYSHGFLIVPIAAYLAWERRGRFAARAIRPAASGLLVIAGSVAVLAAGILGAELFLTRISMLGMLVGIVLFLFGWARLRVVAFPLAFLLLMVPLPAIIFNQIAFPLQILASQVGESVLRAFNVPVLREGNVLVLANATLEVAEACSGIRSLISLLTLGIVWGYFSDRRGWMRVLIAASTIPVAVVSNGARIAGTGIAAERFGPAAAEGFFHEFSGWVIFIVAFVLMLGIQALMTRLAPQPASAEPVAAVV